MPVTEEHLIRFGQMLPESSILQPGSPAFNSNSVPWSLSYDKQPSLVLLPSSESELQDILKYLYHTDLDFAIRSSGCGNSSASDVIISTRNFTNLTFDGEKEIVEVGAGLNWGDVDRKLATLAPGYVVVGSRCPYVGVAGSTLMGGLSWLSHELGLGSDPSNFLDARTVLAHGSRTVWASDAPDLLWALRGGGGNFGVVTVLRLKAHKYPASIWSGWITYEDSKVALPEISRRVAEFAKKPDPKMACHILVSDFRKQELHGSAKEPIIALLPFDGHGQEHALSDQGFKWALDVPGARNGCSEMPLSGVHELQRTSEASHGKAQSWLNAPLVGDVDEGFVVRCWDWYKEIADNATTGKFAMATFALLEIMQERCMMNVGSPDATAWPHAALGQRHVLQLSTGCPPGQVEEEIRKNEVVAMEILANAPKKIAGKTQPQGHYLPNFTLPINDVSQIFGQNWGKLRKVKAQYDPQNKFNKGFSIPPA